jgi:dynein heavy chain, axonemal
MAQSHAFRVQIQALEDGILAKLAGAAGDITEDRELIVGLENTKRMAQDIAEKSAIGASSLQKHGCC